MKRLQADIDALKTDFGVVKYHNDQKMTGNTSMGGEGQGAYKILFQPEPPRSRTSGTPP